jgi:hypothetical protein
MKQRMNKMFKKSLVASALLLAAFNSSAAVNAIAATTVSQEGSAGAASIAMTDNVVTLAAEYTVGDTVTFTVSGAEIDTALSTPTLTAALLAGDAATTGLLSTTASTVTFRVTAQTDGAANGVIYTGGTFTLAGVVLKTATVLDTVGKITSTYSAATSTGIVVDSATTNAATAATVVAQFSSSVTKPANAIIDVSNNREQFTAGNDTITTDVIIVTPVEAVVTVNDAAYTGATHVLNGDFSWMETDGDAGIDAGELAAAFAATGAADGYTSVVDTAGTKITVTVADAAAANTLEAMTATFTNLGVSATATPNAQLPTQVITVDSTINYNTAAAAVATKSTAAGASAGSWTLNGSDDDIAFLPFGSDYAQSITVTNSGTVAGAITVDLTAGGTTYTKTLTAVADAKSVTNISLEVAAFAAASGITDNARIKVVVNAPDANNEIQVKGLYFHKPTTDRVLTY